VLLIGAMKAARRQPGRVAAPQYSPMGEVERIGRFARRSGVVFASVRL